ncbi:MAG: glycosyltransferase family 4 protein [Bacteroidetes bacterium]|nr:glycosyltransferase family 4 protein [Bacteroidota bacterium]
MSKKIIIGTNALTYPELRNFAGLNIPNTTFKKVKDFYKIPSFIIFKLFNKLNRKWQNSFFDLGINKVAFFHFFNVISLDKKPFITTYEATLPRWRNTPYDFVKGMNILAKPNCIQIIALSECAFNMQKVCIQKYAPQFLDVIMSKNIIMLPPQEPIIKQYSDKILDPNFIVFTIVGADFFRKGGQAILNVFKKLLAEKKNIKLNIVSSLNYGDYASKTSIMDKINAIQIIEKYPDNINYYEKLNNNDVQKILKQTHIALLPSLAETFGFFILEAQAAGCPVITTDVRAMPEINNGIKGWSIHTKNKGSYDADISNPNKLILNIEKQLLIIILEILSNPGSIKEKGILAHTDIIKNHSIEVHSQKLMAIYNKI